MNRRIRIAVLGLALAASSAALPARADPRAPLVDYRQHEQALRIRQGVASGALTAPETRRLAAEQRAIRVEERAYRADGVLTRRERADLGRDQNAASRHIWFEKHDRQHRR